LASGRLGRGHHARWVRFGLIAVVAHSGLACFLADCLAVESPGVYKGIRLITHFPGSFAMRLHSLLVLAVSLLVAPETSRSDSVLASCGRSATIPAEAARNALIEMVVRGKYGDLKEFFCLH
jgi:hypothetical protein